MKRSGTIPSGGIRPPDLVALAARRGPFATVWLELSGLGMYGEPGDAARIEEAIGELQMAGTPDEVRATVEQALLSVEPGVSGVAVVADRTGVVLVERLGERARRRVVRWAPLPSLGAVLEHRQAGISAIVVLADRVGADILIRSPHEQSVEVDVEGDDDPISKSAPGGWSQRRYQQRAENTWERNATEVAGQVVDLASRTDPALIVLAGDVRAVDFIVDHLPGELQSIVRTVRGGRAANGSERQRDEEVDRLVRNAVAEDTVALLRRFEEEVGRSDQAAHGPAATMASLRRSQVDVLLVHDDPDDDRVAWFVDTPGMAGMSREDLLGVDEQEPVAARMVDVVINAALRTGAAVRVVPDADVLEGGVGALLRWS